MSEPVLKSIIQLLAILASIDGEIKDSERRVIRDFINENLNDDSARNYIGLFEEYADIALAGNVEAVNICNRINVELNQKQKIIVLFHLLELLSVDGKASSDEVHFVDNVALGFNVDVHEYNIIKAFVTDDDALQLGLSNILTVSNQTPSTPGAKHIYRPNLEATIGILRIPSVEMYMLKYFGNESNIFLNGVLLKDRHIYSFSNGSSVRSERITSIYYSDVVSNFLEKDHKSKITFEAKHVYYTFPGGKVGLRDINLSEESGRLIGIMGSSGSGKSTLLNVMNGNEIPIGGTVTINGLDIHNIEEKEEIKGVIGYVPQDDLLIEELTVFQNMYYAAKLCFGHYSEGEIKKLVSKTLRSLGLLDISHLKVGNSLQKTISGGQRKRLNIGLELLREPSVLFVDEPTSGLSSSDSENILDLLKELSLKGKLIFVVIHQPSSDIFKMFDRLIILDVGGYQIYYGNPIDAVTYFKRLANLINPDEAVCPHCGNVNAEQIFNIIETKLVDEYGRYTNSRKTSPVQWRKHFEEEMPNFSVSVNTEPPPVTLSIPKRIKQWAIFAKRDILAKLSNTQYMVIALLEAPTLAFILAFIVRYYHIDHSVGKEGYLFSDNMNIPAYAFMSIIVALFIGLTVSAEEIIKDAKILKREAFLHLSRTSYLLSKIVILFSFSAVQTFSFVLIGNMILDIQGMYLTYWGVLFSTACFANILGLNISSTFNSVITIYILIPILLIPQLVLGGIVVKFDDINPHLASDNKVPFISEFMTSRWAFEALMVSQFKHNPYEAIFYEQDQKMAIAEYKKVYYIPKLESTVAYCITHFENTDVKIRQTIDEDIMLLAREVRKQSKELPKIKFKNVKELHPDRFSLETAERLKKYLKALNKHYMRAYNLASKQKDQLVRKMTKTEAEREAFLSKARQYHNETVADLVKNANETNRIVEINGKLIQKIYPVFHETASSKNVLNFRTHFFAPSKPLFGYQIDTLHFNIAIIWLMTIGLYFALYYRVFRESFKVFSTLFARKRRRQ